MMFQVTFTSCVTKTIKTVLINWSGDRSKYRSGTRWTSWSGKASSSSSSSSYSSISWVNRKSRAWTKSRAASKASASSTSRTGCKTRPVYIYFRTSRSWCKSWIWSRWRLIIETKWRRSMRFKIIGAKWWIWVQKIWTIVSCKRIKVIIIWSRSVWIDAKWSIDGRSGSSSVGI